MAVIMEGGDEGVDVLRVIVIASASASASEMESKRGAPRSQLSDSSRKTPGLELTLLSLV